MRRNIRPEGHNPFVIRKLLIANRGEIAVRIIRTAKALGIETVAVYSSADTNSMHAALADQAIHIGDADPTASYLNTEAILDACRSSGADGLHPGYGFLSERPELSDACAEAGIAFVGPTGDAMRKLGSKIDAKRIALEAGVPIAPGFFEPGASMARLRSAASEIGYPVMLKASAGGGGRGMRIVRNDADFESELRIASDEALKGFGDGTMMVEKLVERPRHVEVQIIADKMGNVAPLFERECSIQRRHQKLIEEAPAPTVTSKPELWANLRQASVALAKAAGYSNAGTCEFLVDDATGECYFLEVNARLQVEHPVTEAVTGLDMVDLQLQVAAGKSLALDEGLMAGDRTRISGHAIEVRIVAEDPANNFMPSLGTILAFAAPRHPGIRVDTGFSAGSEITRFYDSLIAKVISHGSDREGARKRLVAALKDFHILGIVTNIEYLISVLESKSFVSGNYDTGTLGRDFGEWEPATSIPDELGSIAEASSLSIGPSAVPHAYGSAWNLLDDFRNIRSG